MPLLPWGFLRPHLLPGITLCSKPPAYDSECECEPECGLLARRVFFLLLSFFGTGDRTHDLTLTTETAELNPRSLELGYW